MKTFKEFLEESSGKDKPGTLEPGYHVHVKFNNHPAFSDAKKVSKIQDHIKPHETGTDDPTRKRGHAFSSRMVWRSSFKNKADAESHAKKIKSAFNKHGVDHEGVVTTKNSHYVDR